jgi:hypothetical protein
MPSYLADEHDRNRLDVSYVIPAGQPGDAYLMEISHHLREHFGIQHATLQVETGPGSACALPPIMFFDKTDLERVLREGFTGNAMTQVDALARQAEIGRRLSRLPLVLLLTVGLLLSLLHCARCGFDFATLDTTTISTNLDGSLPDTPEQQLLCHSGHCLLHVTALHVTIAVSPADLAVRQPVSGREQFPAALAGLPLFKPPRA